MSEKIVGVTVGTPLNPSVLEKKLNMNDYATEKYVQEYAQPKGNYAMKSEIPSVPVQSVNGKTGAVQLSAADVKARPDNWMPTAQEVGALPSTYTPPNQTAEQVGADPTGTAASAVYQHNVSADSHGDIRLELKAIADRLSAFLDSDDVTLDQLSELISGINSNKTLIEAVTTGKVNVTDIINNLTSNVANKPLSAAQGVVLKGLIDAVSNSLASYALKSEIPTKVSQLQNDSGYLTEHQDISGLLPRTELPTAINTALAQAKQSGEFNGKNGEDASVTEANIKSALGYTPANADDVSEITDSLFEEATVTHEVKGANILPESMQWVEGYSIKNWSPGSTTMNDLNTGSGSYTSEIIEVEPGVEYVMVKSTGGSSGRSAFGIYDADGVSIKYIKASDGNTFLIPENGKYIRFTCNSSQKDTLVSIQPVDEPGQDWVAKVASRTEIVTETVTVDKIQLFEQSMMRRSRFIVFSDLHYNENSSDVAASDERMQLLVDSINAEHAKRTVDFCIFNGDIAIGYLKSSVEAFATKWADKFKMPVFWFPGDHDDVNDANWTKIFGNHRQASLEDQNFYFIWMDVYSDANDDGAESSGVRTSSVIDTAWVEQEIAKAGNKPVILMTHYVYAETWYPDIFNLLNRYPQIKAVISSHSHNNSVDTIGDNNAAFIQTGNFSYPNGADWTKKGSNNEHLWGFANFEIEDGGLYHWYIQPAYNYTNVSVNMPYTEGKKSLIYAMPNVKKGADINLTRYRK